MIRYCLGFIFSPDTKEVLLIHKERSFYRGTWNGLGGLVNPGEGTFEAMQREWQEECGLDIEGGHAVASVMPADQAWKMDVYAVIDPRIAKAKTTTDEEVKCFKVAALTDLSVAPFVRPLVYMSMDRLKAPTMTPLVALHTYPDVR